MSNKLLKCLKNPLLLIFALGHREFFNWMSDETYLKILFRVKLGKKLDIKNPQTFNEKIQWLKLYDRKPIYTKMVDKYEAKKYIADQIGEQYVIPTLGVWDKFDDIDFNSLPNQFVLKCTHDSGGLVICEDKSKLDVKAARKKITKCLKHNFYWGLREWPYKDVVPRIIAEPYLEDATTKELRDYKFFCFNGKVHFFKIDFNRKIEHHANYFDCEGNMLDLGEVVCPPIPQKELRLPTNLKKMIDLAEKLSVGICFLRVDFYELNDRVLFGELTFYPASGLGRFTIDKWDKIIGQYIKLPLG